VIAKPLESRIHITTDSISASTTTPSAPTGTAASTTTPQATAAKTPAP
jgi:hypothetical protein